MTDIEAEQLFAMLMAAFPYAMGKHTAEQRKRTASLYRFMLLDLDAKSAAQAIQRLIASSKFLPTVAEIRTALVEVDSGVRRPGGHAWADFLAAVRRFGANRTPTFDDPLVAQTVNALGWRELCLSENQVADRARFIELYDQLANIERHEQQMPPQLRRTLSERTGTALHISSALVGVYRQLAASGSSSKYAAGAFDDADLDEVPRSLADENIISS